MPTGHEQQPSGDDSSLVAAPGGWQGNPETAATEHAQMHKRGTKRSSRYAESDQHQLSVSLKNSDGPETGGAEVPDKKMKPDMGASDPYRDGAMSNYEVGGPEEEKLGPQDMIPQTGEEVGSDLPTEEGFTDSLPTGEDVDTVVRRITSEARDLYTKWQEPFGESEAFELFCPARVDELLKEALTLEESLKKQKEELRQRLRLLTRTLEML